MVVDLSITTRRRLVAEAIAKEGFMPLAALASQFGVSESTLRRDLESLDESGLVKRTHGGAVYVKSAAPQPLGFADRESTAMAEKSQIARAIAAMVQEEETIILDGGTTCFRVARELAGRRLCVATNSVPIAGVLMGELATEVTLIGGYVYPRTGVALGDAALRHLEGLAANRLVLSCAGVMDGSAYNSNQMMVAVERRMMLSAGRVILAADHNKLGSPALVKLCELAEIDVIVTDAGATAEQLAALEAGGAKRILVADEQPEAGA